MNQKKSFFSGHTKQKKIVLALIFALFLAAILSVFYSLGVFKSLEFISADWRRNSLSPFKLNPKSFPGSADKIVYIDVDQGSLDAAMTDGISWPWPRDGYALVLEYVQYGGAKAVVFDMFMHSPMDGDEMFADFLGNYKNVVFPMMFRNPDIPGNQDFELIVNRDMEKYALDFETDNSVVHRSLGVASLLPTGLVNENIQWAGDAYIIRVGADLNHTRQNGPVIEYNGRYYPSLALAGILAAKGTKKVRIQNKKLIISENTDKTVIPLNKNGFMWIKYNGPYGVYEHYPIYTVIQSAMGFQAMQAGDSGMHDLVKIKSDVFKDKVVVFLASAYGLKDLRPNPFSDNDPGGHFHGSAMETMLNNDFIVDLYDLKYVIPVLFLFCLGVCLLGAMGNPRFSGLFAFVLLVGYFGLSAVCYLNNILLETVAGLTAILLAYILGAGISFVFERRQKSFIQGAFSQFLAPAVLDKLMKNPASLTLGGEEKELSVFFSDLQGFTSLSEKLTAPKLVEILNKYLTAMADVIVVDYHGYVDKYEGDAIMAFWGAPLPDDNHAVNACYAALDNQARLKDIQEILKSYGLESDLVVRIGINTGKVVVGMMGSEKKLNYTVIGDAVNLASRLEGANKAFQSRIMISESTYLQAKEAIIARELDLLRVKGKKQPVRVFELIAKKSDYNAEINKFITSFEQGLSFYRKKIWDKAIEKFEEAVVLQKNDGPSSVYIERCRIFSKTPPPAEWDGVFTMTTK